MKVVIAAAIAALMAGVGPARADAGEDDRGGLLHPHGSLLYATGVAELGLIVGRAPGVGGLATGVHYAERGGLLANVLAAAAPGMAAQAEANRTGRSVTYRQPDPDEFGRMGLTVDAYARSLGGETSGLSTDFFGIIKIGETLPWSIDLGATFLLFSRTDEDAGILSSEAGGLGLYLGVIAPVTRFVQLETRGRLMIGDLLYAVDLGGLVHLSDRFYVRGAFVLTELESGPMLGVGGRL